MRPWATRWARYTAEERNRFIIEASLYVRCTRAVLLYERRGWYRIIIEFVRGDVPAVFPFNGKVVDKDLSKLLYIFEWRKEGDVQIGLYIEVSVFPVGESHTQYIITQGLYSDRMDSHDVPPIITVQSADTKRIQYFLCLPRFPPLTPRRQRAHHPPVQSPRSVHCYFVQIRSALRARPR